MTTNDVPDILDVKEAAALLRVHSNTIYQLASVGQVPCRRVGRQYRFSRAALERWLEAQDEADDGAVDVIAMVPVTPKRNAAGHLH